MVATTVATTVAPVDATPVDTAVSTGVATPASTDYSKYASMSETPAANERRKFDYVAVSGAVDTETITTAEGNFEKIKPASAFKLLLTKDRDVNNKAQSEELAMPLTVVPIKYRMVMEHKTGPKGEILVLRTSEFNGKTSDIITVTRFGADGKPVSTSAPMTVLEARKKYQTAGGKNALRDKAHIYSLVNGDLVRFVVKGTGLWEMESELHNGKTEASRAKYPFLAKYLSEFAMNDPYFLYEMQVNAAYRDHGSIKYYRPTFTKGNRISAETEKVVLEHLEDLFVYFQEMDAATKAYVPSEGAITVEDPTVNDPTEEDPNNY
jgi:hypothetical protein